MLSTGDEVQCFFCVCSWFWESSYPQIKLKNIFRSYFFMCKGNFQLISGVTIVFLAIIFSTDICYRQLEAGWYSYMEAIQGKKQKRNMQLGLKSLAEMIKGNLWLQGVFPLHFKLARKASCTARTKMPCAPTASSTKEANSSTLPAVWLSANRSLCDCQNFEVPWQEKCYQSIKCPISHD